jgi:glucosylglycerate synthase
LVETQTTFTEAEIPGAMPRRADLAVAIAGHTNADTIGPVLRAAEQGMSRAFPGRSGLFLLADLHAAEGSAAAARDAVTDPDRLIQLAVPADGQRAAPLLARAQILRLIFESAASLGVEALAVIDADLTTLEPDGLGRLLRPVLEHGADFVGPYYARPRFAGAITSSIVYPFTRALYGRRLRFPAGGDFACSSRFGQTCAAQPVWSGDGGRIATDLWLVHRALTGGFKLSQAVIGTRSGSAADEDAELSAVLTRVLGTLFGEAERNVPIWQKIRTSEPVPLVGTPAGADLGGLTIDLKQTVDAFRLGLEHLVPVWELVLPPTTRHELKKLARRSDDDFRLPDALWARIVYDFAIAFHARVMSREHLLSAFAPLYLGWFGSHVAEMADADVARSERRVEELCLRFEAEKPYLISRWRWPDRFNP